MSGGSNNGCVTGASSLVGAEVEVRGLVSRQELNGRTGVVEGPCDPATGRHPVRLLPEGVTVMGLKAANFTVIVVVPAPATARFKPLADGDEANIQSLLLAATPAR